MDYDSARHNFQSLLNAKKRDEAKIAKVSVDNHLIHSMIFAKFCILVWLILYGCWLNYLLFWNLIGYYLKGIVTNSAVNCSREHV